MLRTNWMIVKIQTRGILRKPWQMAKLIYDFLEFPTWLTRPRIHVFLDRLDHQAVHWSQLFEILFYMIQLNLVLFRCMGTNRGALQLFGQLKNFVLTDIKPKPQLLIDSSIIYVLHESTYDTLSDTAMSLFRSVFFIFEHSGGLLGWHQWSYQGANLFLRTIEPWWTCTLRRQGKLTLQAQSHRRSLFFQTLLVPFALSFLCNDLSIIIDLFLNQKHIGPKLLPHGLKASWVLRYLLNDLGNFLNIDNFKCRSIITLSRLGNGVCILLVCRGHLKLIHQLLVFQIVLIEHLAIICPNQYIFHHLLLYVVLHLLAQVLIFYHQLLNSLCQSNFFLVGPPQWLLHL